MVLGRGFESHLGLKVDENDGPLDGRKNNENNKVSKMGQVTPKQFKKVSQKNANRRQVIRLLEAIL